jgi:pyruvate-formate lyase-activating enzyme
MSYIVGYEEVLLTGGEPMLAPERVIEFAQEARKYNPNCRIYLYTALCPWNPIMHKVIEAVDGVHFALHAPASDEDIMGFQFMQSLAKEYPDKSFRLHFDADLDIPISLNPSVWDRIESKPWLIDCPVPENETLYFIESMVD